MWDVREDGGVLKGCLGIERLLLKHWLVHESKDAPSVQDCHRASCAGSAGPPAFEEFLVYRLDCSCGTCKNETPETIKTTSLLSSDLAVAG